jgi:putative ABC transport system substrate-binding protein
MLDLWARFQMTLITRRHIAAILGGATAWPIAARAQQMPVVGFLSSTTAEGYANRFLPLFRRGLAESGCVEGRNVAIEFRWADNQYDRLTALAADLVQRRVAVIVSAGAVNTTVAAKEATATIPIIFSTGSDPVQLGIVPSLARPGANVTGVTGMSQELLPKRLQILRELVPHIAAIGFLVNPNNPNAELGVNELRLMAQSGGWALHVAPVKTESELDTAIADLVRQGAGAFLHATDALFNAASGKMVTLASRYRIPAIYAYPDAAESGGLMSYGGSLSEEWLTVGRYTGRVLKGEKPADLPVQQTTKVELIINLKTAKTLGLTFPTGLLVRADEVIE